MTIRHASPDAIESPYAWARLFVSLLIMTIGSSGMYTITVVLPQIETEFSVSRGDASLPYMLTMIGFGLGSVLMGRFADMFGIFRTIIFGAVCLGGGYWMAGAAQSLLAFSIAQALLIGIGAAGSFTPLVADTSQWFYRRRGIAVAICMSGNYLAGTLWPPVVQHFIESAGWRLTYQGTGLFCLVSMLALSWMCRLRPPVSSTGLKTHSNGPVRRFAQEAASSNPARPLGFSPGALQALLCIAGVACCVAMAMPQVHIVAYCMDLGFGAARGAQMLSLMLGLGIISRLGSGWISDHIGGLRTLLLGSALQGLALCMFLAGNGLVSLYVISGMFGLFQGGIVPAYALVVREYFSPREAGARVGVVLMATLFGMALGGWMSGVIYDASGSYKAAFINGIGWNLLNASIMMMLIYRARRGLQRTEGLAQA
ncbi:MFS transporter [Alcaligenaceae bacterium]|nr:MFS transporter [Alcaligenaceae bacterium]